MVLSNAATVLIPNTILQTQRTPEETKKRRQNGNKKAPTSSTPRPENLHLPRGSTHGTACSGRKESASEYEYTILRWNQLGRKGGRKETQKTQAPSNRREARRWRHRSSKAENTSKLRLEVGRCTGEGATSARPSPSLLSHSPSVLFQPVSNGQKGTKLTQTSPDSPPPHPNPTPILHDSQSQAARSPVSVPGTYSARPSVCSCFQGGGRS